MTNQKEIQMLTMKTNAIARYCFEEDQEFPKEAKNLLELYDQAAKRAARSAKFAVSAGGMEAIQSAQWDEAVTQTLECCLRVFLYPSDDLEYPEKPEFFKS